MARHERYVFLAFTYDTKYHARTVVSIVYGYHLYRLSQGVNRTSLIPEWLWCAEALRRGSAVER